MVEENKRQLCMQKVASDAGKPWLWWQYASLFATHCRMHSQRFNDACAEEQVQATGLNYAAVQDCMGDSRADMDNPLMEVSALESLFSWGTAVWSLHQALGPEPGAWGGSGST